MPGGPKAAKPPAAASIKTTPRKYRRILGFASLIEKDAMWF
jgi:hypothetical protein